ncbi:hypothetical protein R5R35_010119 [Gryllus longicercus]|uniref:RNA-directed DNA polymerase n=1 Tax=Gryllus longicercus TaxID=2509291 RepID=A0AAN9Z2H3_9ORTH
MADDEKKINMKNDLDDKKVKGEIDEQNDKETKIQETPKQIRQTVMKGGSVINIKEIETFTVAKLQEELEKLKVPTDGKKLILIERLKTAAIFLGKTNDPEKKDIMNKDEDDIKTKNESNTEKENDMDSDEYYAHFFSDNIGDKRKKVSKTEKKVLYKKSSRPTSSESESEEELGYDSRNSKKLSLNMKKGKLNFDTSDYSESDDSSDQEMLKQPTKTKRRDHRWRDMRETRYEHDRRECNEREHDRRERNEHERDRRERDRRERSRREGNRAKHEFTIRDVENSLTEFSGDDKIQVEQWLNEFEDISNLLEWHDLQKIIYAKRMLKGSAKKFMLTKKISTWKKIKKDLTKEFITKLSSATVHSQLRKRKRLSDETAKQYIYSMIEIANQGTVDEEALVEYIIDGIQDYESNKAILYSARNIQELKKCFEAYERMKEKSKGRQTTTQKEESNHRNKENKNQTSSTKEDHGNKNSDGKRPGQKRCFSCGSKEHERVNCTNKDKGPKCFKCNMFGHIAPNCTKESQSVGCISSNDEGLISMKVRGRNYRALLDTGSDVNLVPTDIYEKIGRPEMSPTTRCFTGLGNKTTNPVGRVKLDIEIDNQVYSTPFYVVPKDSMKYNFILGQEWIKDMEITISQGKISVRQVPARCEQGQDNDGLLLNATYTEFHEDLKVLQCIAVDEIDVPAPYEVKVRQLLEDYSPQKQVKTNIETKIKLKDDDPVCLQPRRLAPKEKKILSDQIKEWLEKDIIRPSDSEYASPVVIVPKKDGSHRVCIDFRQLNKKIVRDRFPMPLVDDKIDALVNFSVFSVVDLKNGFFHVPVEKNSQKYTSFVTPDNQYEFVKTPFGLCNSPTSFLRFVDNVFKDLVRKSIAITYMDDIIIPGKDYDDAFDNLVQVLKVAAENGLELNRKKCKFLQTKIEFLGYVVESGSVTPSPTKIKAVQHFPEPKTVKQVQSFLGLTGYFRRFVKDYAKMAYPLYEVRDGQHFFFGNTQKLSFSKLKEALSNEPVLRIYDPEAVTELHTDASKLGYGAVLLQKKPDEKYFHPVHYMSRKTSEGEKKWCSYELEVLAIIEALKKIKVYLLGIRFKIITDCHAFQKTLGKINLPPKVTRWALQLEEFDYEIEHRMGDRMKHVDALSRNPVMMVEDLMLEVIKKEQKKEERLNVIIQLLLKEPYEDYSMQNEILMKTIDGRNVVVLPTSMQQEVLKKVHDNGHFGTKKMQEIIQADYYVPRLREKLDHLVECCITCIMAEKKKGKKEGLLQPIPKGDIPLHTYHVDHIGPITATSKLYKYLFVVVDSFSKFTWIFPIKTTNASEVLSKMDIMQASFGNPYRIISARGAAFTSTTFQEYCAKEKIEHVLTTTGVPRGNGQVERINGIIVPVLTKFSKDKPEQWYRHVNKLQRCINSTFQRSISRSPFEVLFGVKMRHQDDVAILEVLEQEAVELFDREREDLRNAAKKSILKIQEENKKYHDKHSKEARNYQEWDIVAIRRTQFGPGMKIKQKYLGPYKVSQVKGNDRYEVIRVGNFDEDGSMITTTSADYMKPYVFPSEAEGFRGWPNVGLET